MVEGQTYVLAYCTPGAALPSVHTHSRSPIDARLYCHPNNGGHWGLNSHLTPCWPTTKVNDLLTPTEHNLPVL